MSNYSLHLKLLGSGKYRLFLRGADMSGAWYDDVSGELDLEEALQVEEASRGVIQIDSLAGVPDPQLAEGQQ
ncbi:hypothetical protein [Brevundimonas sp.]|uniref:hypothetical protein n=1 Tax=Brevundimonas sp. TaxID=1871086 RepID=UPI0028A14E25|nr:hypothetical protein [Brevundimonas sp.]